MPQNRPVPEKCGLTVYSISHGRFIFAHIQVGGRARVGGGGKAAVSKKQGENLFTAKTRLFMGGRQVGWACETERVSVHGKNLAV
jgi:hypothetical protein